MMKRIGYEPRKLPARRYFSEEEESPMFQDLLDLCIEKQKDHKIYIQTHNFPDPDAIASAFGLQQLLQANGVTASICYEGKIDKLNTAKMIETFGVEMREYAELSAEMQEDDCIICVDSQKLGGNITDFMGDEAACVDHHPVCGDVEYQYCDIRTVGACATLIADYFRQAGQEPDSNTATALLYGLKMDTAQFSRGVTELDVEMFRYLLPLTDREKISLLEHSTMEFQDLQAYGAAIENIRVYESFGFSFIPFACPDALVAMLSDFILSLSEVDIAVTCSERPDGFKLSVRSARPEVNAGELVQKALAGLGSGGGHASMAGGFVKRGEIERLTKFPSDMLRDRFLLAWARTAQSGGN